ncbi:MAG: hypothetical protein HYY04_00015 [Chloroflexi bacterium]|nr:hypothetical protein [Chloroflexota bacterium]
MAPQTRISRRVAVGLLGSSLVLVACAGGVSQSEYDATRQKLSAEERKSAALQQQLSAKEKEVADLQQRAAPPGAPAGVTTLIGAQKVPTPAPPPTPTPLPPGATPPPKPAPPASLYDPVPFAFYVETLATTSVSPYGVASTVACTPNSVFKRGMKIVWRFEVIDTSTGKRLTDKDSPTIKVKLPHGDELTSRFSQRAGGRVPDAPWMWSAAWDIPLDYPLGSFDYGITVVGPGGRTGSFKVPALVSPPSTDSRVKIID